MYDLEPNVTSQFFYQLTEDEATDVYNKLVDKYNELRAAYYNNIDETAVLLKQPTLKSGKAPRDLKNYQIRYTQIIQYSDGICGNYESGAIVDLDNNNEYYLNEDYAKLMVDTAERRAATEVKRQCPQKQIIKEDFNNISNPIKLDKQKIEETIKSKEFRDLVKDITNNKILEKCGLKIDSEDKRILDNYINSYDEDILR